jgi:hypothetical protein
MRSLSKMDLGYRQFWAFSGPAALVRHPYYWISSGMDRIVRLTWGSHPAREEAIAKLAQWFPKADHKNLRAFVDSGWDGDVDDAFLDVMTSAFQEGQDCECPIIY